MLENGQWNIAAVSVASCCRCCSFLSPHCACLFAWQQNIFFVLGAKPSFARTSEGLNAFCCAKLVVTEYHNC